MGLDNGIKLKVKNKKVFKPFFVKFDDFDFIEGIEVCYWRKCWAIRNDIINVLNRNHFNGVRNQNRYKWPVKSSDINDIIRVIKSWRNQKRWDAYAESIWEYEEIKDRLRQQITSLRWLKYYLKFHPNVECYFYDSY